MSEQLRLPNARSKPTLPAQRAAEHEANVRLARIILAKPDLYAGLQVEWARAVVEKQAG